MKDEDVKNVHDYPVMKAKCFTCPFNEYGDKAIREMVESRLLKVSQICHHPALSGKPQTHLCRGARDFQLDIMFKLRFLSEPTDEAWDNKRKELGI